MNVDEQKFLVLAQSLSILGKTRSVSRLRKTKFFRKSGVQFCRESEGYGIFLGNKTSSGIFLIINGFVKHFRIKISDIKSERRFDDSMSSLSSFKYMIELIIYIVAVV